MGARWNGTGREVGGMTSLGERARRLILWIAARERLPEPPASAPATRSVGFVRWLFAPEPLPRPSEGASPEEVRVFPWLFGRESLPPSSKEGGS